MSAEAFDWDSVPTGEVQPGGLNYRWRRGSVHVLLATELPEVLVFIDRLTLTLLNPDEVRGFVALLRREADSASFAGDLEIRPGIGGGLCVGGESDTVEFGLTDEEAASLIDGLTAILPYMDVEEDE